MRRLSRLWLACLLVLSGLMVACRIDPRLQTVGWMHPWVDGRLLLIDGRFEPERPTLVFTHGFNLNPLFIRTEMMISIPQAAWYRTGGQINALGWDWNSSALHFAHPMVYLDEPLEQGRKLADELLARGIDPQTTHLAGYSLGAIVMARAAKVIHEATGRKIAQLTLLEPVATHHPLLFGVLQPTLHAEIVDHYWAASPSGLGGPAPDPAVFSHQLMFEPPGPPLLISPFTNDHTALPFWYLATADDPALPGGFNDSILLLLTDSP